MSLSHSKEGREHLPEKGGAPLSREEWCKTQGISTPWDRLTREAQQRYKEQYNDYLRQLQSGVPHGAEQAPDTPSTEALLPGERIEDERDKTRGQAKEVTGGGDVSDGALELDENDVIDLGDDDGLSLDEPVVLGEEEEPSGDSLAGADSGSVAGDEIPKVSEEEAPHSLISQEEIARLLQQSANSTADAAKQVDPDASAVPEVEMPANAPSASSVPSNSSVVPPKAPESDAVRQQREVEEKRTRVLELRRNAIEATWKGQDRRPILQALREAGDGGSQFCLLLENQYKDKKSGDRSVPPLEKLINSSIVSTSESHEVSSSPSAEPSAHAVTIEKKGFWSNRVSDYRGLREKRGWKLIDSIVRIGGHGTLWGYGTNYVVNGPTGRAFLTQFPVYATGPACAGISALPLLPRMWKFVRNKLSKKYPTLRYQIEEDEEASFDQALKQLKDECHIVPDDVKKLIKEDIDKPTHELVDTNNEEILLTAFDAYLWPDIGKVPMFPSVDGYIHYLFPKLVGFCQLVADNNPEDEKTEPKDPRVRRLNLTKESRDIIAQYAGRKMDMNIAAVADQPTAKDKWKNLRQVAIAHAQGLEMWHHQRSNGQIRGALLANAAVLGYVSGPVGPLACGAVAGVRWGLNAYHFRNVDMERGKDGKLQVNLDPDHFDAGGISLYSQGNFIADLEGDTDGETKKAWTADEKIKDWLARIRNLSIGDKELKSGSLRSPRHLAVRFAKRVQQGLATSTQKKKVRDKPKDAHVIEAKEEERKVFDKGRSKALQALDDLPSVIKGLKSVFDDKNVEFEAEEKQFNDRRDERKSKREELQRGIYHSEIQKDANGKAVEVDVIDADGKVVEVPEMDADGNAVMVPKTNAKGRPFMELKKDTDGKTVSVPKMVHKMVHKKVPNILESGHEVDIRDKRNLIGRLRKESPGSFEIGTLTTEISDLQKRIERDREEIARLQRQDAEEDRKLKTVKREADKAKTQLDEKERELADAKIALAEAIPANGATPAIPEGKYCDSKYKKLLADLDALKNGEKKVMTYEEIGNNDDASKAFAIWVTESWKRLRQRPGVPKFLEPAVSRVASLLGEAGATITTTAAGTAAVAAGTGTVAYIAGKIMLAAGSARWGAMLSSPSGWGLIGAAFGALTLYSMGKSAFQNFQWGKKPKEEKKKE